MAGTILTASLAFCASNLSPTKAAAAEAPPTDTIETTNAGGTETNTENPANETEGTTNNEANDPATDTEGATNDIDNSTTNTENTPTTQKEIKFNDTAGTYFTEPVEVLVDKGVVFGVTDDAFVPYRDVTRAEAAAMLARALNLDTEKAAKLAI